MRLTLVQSQLAPSTPLYCTHERCRRFHCQNIFIFLILPGAPEILRRRFSRPFVVTPWCLTPPLYSTLFLVASDYSNIPFFLSHRRRVSFRVYILLVVTLLSLACFFSCYPVFKRSSLLQHPSPITILPFFSSNLSMLHIS